MVDPIFVAPHYDDVALSCGGLVSATAKSASPLILTVFGGKPDDLDLSDFAAEMHDQWGLAPAEAVERRREEDCCASKVLGESVRSRWLPFEDAIYRSHAYDSNLKLFGRVLDNGGLVDEVARAIGSAGGGPIYAPMGVGNHVDHQIVFRAVPLLTSAGREVYFYADLPYALDRAAFCARLQNLAWGSTFAVEMDEE
ncbi:MAG: PIG-L deacetylase family protein, partial [Chloroflexota bacterium]